MKKSLEEKIAELEKTNEKNKLELVEQKEHLEQLVTDFNQLFDSNVKNLKNKELTDAKERKSTRTIKNNELEEQWNIRKIEMRKQRDK